MKIDIRNIVKDYEGKNITEQVYDKVKKESIEEPLTIKKVFTNSINNLEQNSTAEEKSKVYLLTQKIYATNDPSFTVEELSFIKEKVGKIYNALVYGRICDVIEGAPKEETKKEAN